MQWNWMKKKGAAQQAPALKGRLSSAFLTGLYHLLRLGLAAIFIYAGLVKLLDPKAFAHALAQFELLPDALLPLVAIVLPAAEVLAGLGLVLNLRFSLAAIQGMLLLFLAYAIFKGLDIDCGCFTVDELAARSTVKAAFFRDLVMMGGVFFLLWARQFRSRFSFGFRQINSKKGEAKNDAAKNLGNGDAGGTPGAGRLQQ
jgi:uncharacterized membrane protein YphA (DoxX/SURF4 family)